MSQKVSDITIELERIESYAFDVHFDKAHYATLRLDEPPPLGGDSGPNPARLLAAALGNCLSASLLFCLQKKGVPVAGFKSRVEMELVRNDAKRLRVGKVRVTLHPSVADPTAIDACREVFEDFCVVTQAVREGIDVAVDVAPT